ncbi:IclR family transcriptional regulator domain-containing protein, partial [Luminiphilus syltensis]|uniref:IclR family transcriptional regulator domain-containing protein n=1 Tax=Luminiphilus syltensis TaxID=1341119 RepID=UPI0006834BB8
MKSSEYLSTLEKGLRVLTCFSREQPQMSLTEVARATDLSPAVARRCLITLNELGYVGKDGNQYLLKPRVLEISTAFTESFNIDNIVRPALQTLREETGDSASLATLQGSDVLYICHASAYRVIRLQATTGTRFPALVTSLGRAILSAKTPGEIDAHIYKHPVTKRTDKTITDSTALKAEITKAQVNGYAVVSDELDYGITSIACPVVLSGGRVVGAVNCSAATGRVDPAT